MGLYLEEIYLEFTRRYSSDFIQQDWEDTTKKVL